MPRTPQQRKGGRHLDQGSLKPKGGLEESQVQPFLEWLFSDLAVNCKPLKLSPSAAAIRYLMDLAWFGVPTEILRQGPEAIRAYWVAPRGEQTRRSREALKQIASILWGNLLQFGQFDASSKEEAQRFLRDHWAFCQHPNLERARIFLDDSEIPPGYPPESASRHFASTRTFQARGNAYLDDDLSERIAAADYALEQSGSKGQHALIAQVLNASPLTADRLPKNVSWGAVEVRERVKTYKRQKNPVPRVQLANNWIGRYRSDIAMQQTIEVNRSTPAVTKKD
jgi:hypothetical protein